MTDSTLSNEEAATLLRKLASDDAFRELFETSPAKALHSMGVAAETIVNLNPRCLCPTKLVDKSDFKSAADTLDDLALKSTMTMHVPKMKIGS